jgi:hypothetical protein
LRSEAPDERRGCFVLGCSRSAAASGVLPGLRDRGVSDQQIEQILIRNPRDFLGQQGTYATTEAQTSSAAQP